MKKLIMGAALAASLLTTQAMAKDSGAYVGFDIGNTEAELTASVGAISVSEKDDGSSQTLKLGYYLNKNSRAAIYYQNISVDGGNGYLYGAAFDYLIGSNDLKPFVGVLIGQSALTDDSNAVPDLKGLNYGVNLGLNYSLNDNFSFDLGYRYLKSNADANVQILGVDVKLEMDPITNWYVGANYKF